MREIIDDEVKLIEERKKQFEKIQHNLAVVDLNEPTPQKLGIFVTFFYWTPLISSNLFRVPYFISFLNFVLISKRLIDYMNNASISKMLLRANTQICRSFMRMLLWPLQRYNSSLINSFLFFHMSIWLPFLDILRNFLSILTNPSRNSNK